MLKSPPDIPGNTSPASSGDQGYSTEHNSESPSADAAAATAAPAPSWPTAITEQQQQQQNEEEKTQTHNRQDPVHPKEEEEETQQLEATTSSDEKPFAGFNSFCSSDLDQSPTKAEHVKNLNICDRIIKQEEAECRLFLPSSRLQEDGVPSASAAAAEVMDLLPLNTTDDNVNNCSSSSNGNAQNTAAAAADNSETTSAATDDTDEEEKDLEPFSITFQLPGTQFTQRINRRTSGRHRGKFDFYLYHPKSRNKAIRSTKDLIQFCQKQSVKIDPQIVNVDKNHPEERLQGLPSASFRKLKNELGDLYEPMPLPLPEISLDTDVWEKLEPLRKNTPKTPVKARRRGTKRRESGNHTSYYWCDALDLCVGH